MQPSRHYVLTVSCPDGVGLVAAVSGLLASWGGWLTEVSNHSDPHTRRFFMRNEITAESLPFGIEEFRQGFLPWRGVTTWSSPSATPRCPGAS